MKRRAIILVVLLSSLLPLGRSGALADTAPPSQLPSGVFSQPDSPGTPVQALWTRTSQTFEKDGLFSTSVYPDSVDYQDASGTWQAIDDTLVSSPVQGYAYQNKANRYTVSLPDDLGGSVPARIETTTGWITFSLNGMHTTGSSVSGNTDTYTFNGGTIALSSLNDELKESITLSSPSSPSTFSFTVNTSSGISLKAAGGNTINVVDAAGKTQFSFERPVMQDAAGATSTGVNFSTTKTQSGITLTATADRSWLNDPARQWPVVIDPTVSVEGNSTVTECYEGSTAGHGIYPCGTMYQWLGYYSGEADRIWLQFDLSAIPSNVQVLNADLNLAFGSHYTSNPIAIGAYQVTQPWTSQMTWTTYDGTSLWATPGGDFDPTPAATTTYPATCTSNCPRLHWYPTQLVQGWVDGTVANDGFILKEPVENVSQKVQSWYQGAGSTLAPALTITYQEPWLGDQATYTLDGETPTAGVHLGVNVANGNLVVDQQALDPSALDLSLAIDQVYNSLLPAVSDLGVGWLPTFGTGVHLYVFPDGATFEAPTGYSVDFTKDSSGAFTPPPGSDLSLAINWDSTYTLTDSVGDTSYVFTGSGVLTSVEIADTTYLFAYDGSGALQSMTDTLGDALTFTHNAPQSSALISQFTDGVGNVYTYAYDASQRLTSYSTSAQGTVQYTYGTNGLLASITTGDGATTDITYDSNQRVASVTDGEDVAAGSGPTRTYAYQAGQTTVTDADGTQTTYSYDSDGVVTDPVPADPGDVCQPQADGSCDGSDPPSQDELDWQATKTQVLNEIADGTIGSDPAQVDQALGLPVETQVSDTTEGWSRVTSDAASNSAGTPLEDGMLPPTTDSNGNTNVAPMLYGSVQTQDAGNNGTWWWVSMSKWVEPDGGYKSVVGATPGTQCTGVNNIATSAWSKYGRVRYANMCGPGVSAAIISHFSGNKPTTWTGKYYSANIPHWAAYEFYLADKEQNLMLPNCGPAHECDWTTEASTLKNVINGEIGHSYYHYDECVQANVPSSCTTSNTSGFAGFKRAVSSSITSLHRPLVNYVETCDRGLTYCMPGWTYRAGHFQAISQYSPDLVLLKYGETGNAADCESTEFGVMHSAPGAYAKAGWKDPLDHSTVTNMAAGWDTVRVYLAWDRSLGLVW